MAPLRYFLCLLFLLACNPFARADAMLQLFNLTWNEVAEKIPEIAEAGYTSLWLPSPTEGGGELSIGYDLFDPFDLGTAISAAPCARAMARKRTDRN